MFGRKQFVVFYQKPFEGCKASLVPCVHSHIHDVLYVPAGKGIGVYRVRGAAEGSSVDGQRCRISLPFSVSPPRPCILRGIERVLGGPGTHRAMPRESRRRCLPPFSEKQWGRHDRRGSFRPLLDLFVSCVCLSESQPARTYLLEGLGWNLASCWHGFSLGSMCSCGCSHRSYCLNGCFHLPSRGRFLPSVRARSSPGPCAGAERRRETQERNAGGKRRRNAQEGAQVGSAEGCAGGERRRGRRRETQEGNAGGQRRRGTPEWSAGGERRSVAQEGRGRGAPVERRRGISGVARFSAGGVLLLGAAACPGKPSRGCARGVYRSSPRGCCCWGPPYVLGAS